MCKNVMHMHPALSAHNEIKPLSARALTFGMYLEFQVKRVFIFKWP